MCGIVGLFLKNKNLEPALGDLLSRMLVTMSARGPDSAGVAIYGAGDDDKVKLTLRVADATSVDDLRNELFAVVTSAFDISIRSSHIVLSVARADVATVIRWLKTHKSDLELVSVGETMEIYKEVGLPEHVVRVFGLSGMSGPAISHTRMATRSAVTTQRPSFRPADPVCPQWVAVKPQCRPPHAAARGHGVFDRERFRGRGGLPDVADAPGREPAGLAVVQPR
jgi:glutamate synthase domain-containing protein 1